MRKGEKPDNKMLVQDLNQKKDKKCLENQTTNFIWNPILTKQLYKYHYCFSN